MSEQNSEFSPAGLPAVPLTLEGAWVSHQMFRFDRSRWNSQTTLSKRTMLRDLAHELRTVEESGIGQSAAFALIGKGDLMLVHFRAELSEIQDVQRNFGGLSLMGFLEPVGDYTSVIELGLYESSVKTFRSLAEKGLTPHTPEWDSAIAETIARQTEAMLPRLYPKIPDSKYICFYPMDRLRGEDKNWYTVPIEERARMMHEHGLVGRRYANSVRQIITGSIGTDDWEWGVDLFADDPTVFKRLIYEMRFDEVSAVYAKFGKFYVGVQCKAGEIEELLLG